METLRTDAQPDTQSEAARKQIAPGATPEEWAHFSDTLRLRARLLPVVSNPNAPVSPSSKLRQVGKVPSVYDRDRRVVGLPGWTERQPPTDKNLEVWAAEPDYGICIRTGGGLVAIDIDVADPVKASAIRDFVSSVISTLLAEGDDDSDDFLLPPLVPVRWRENSGKCLIPVIVEGPQAKRRIEVDDGVVEILGDGQQFVVIGTHPSGVRYQWATGDFQRPDDVRPHAEDAKPAPVQGLPDEIPELTPEQFEILFDSTQRAFGIAPAAVAEKREKVAGPRHAADAKFDPVADFLRERGLVLDEDGAGRLFVRCPWKDDHSGDSGVTEAAWLSAGTGDFERGHYKCVHAHCQGRTDADFFAAIGYHEASDEDFDDLGPPSEPPSVKIDRFRVVPAGEFAAGAPPSWAVKGLLPRAELVVIYGESGSGKSFFALDVALAISRGVAWRNLRTKKLRVVYICAEGAGGFRNRLRAYCAANHIGPADLDIGIVADAPNLLEKDHVKLIEQIEAAGGADIVIVDTFARVMPGGNENASEDTGRAIGRCGLITAKTGATVVLIHHAGKDPTKGARGWSGIKAAADAEIEITRIGDTRVATVTKSKDGEDGGRFHFKLRPVDLGLDDDGDPITSCVVAEAEAPAPEQRPAGKWQSLTHQAILECTGADGTGPTIDEVVEAVKRGTVGPTAGKDDRRRDCVRRALDDMLRAGAVVKNGDRVEVLL